MFIKIYILFLFLNAKNYLSISIYSLKLKAIMFLKVKNKSQNCSFLSHLYFFRDVQTVFDEIEKNF